MFLRPRQLLSTCCLIFIIHGGRANRQRNLDCSLIEERALGCQWQLLQELAGVLGLKAEEAEFNSANAINRQSDAEIEAQIEAQIEARKAAKANRNFAEADNIRAALKMQGIELIDKPGGSTEWLRS
jgi:cysteinyl-tRNA synthetase